MRNFIPFIRIKENHEEPRIDGILTEIGNRNLPNRKNV